MTAACARPAAAVTPVPHLMLVPHFTLSAGKTFPAFYPLRENVPTLSQANSHRTRNEESIPHCRQDAQIIFTGLLYAKSFGRRLLCCYNRPMPSPFDRRRADPYRLVVPGGPDRPAAPPPPTWAESLLPLLLFSTIGACLILFVCGAGLWALDYRLVRGPTPTPTATATGGPTATPNAGDVSGVPAATTPAPDQSTPPADGEAVALPLIDGSGDAPPSMLPGGVALPILSSEQEGEQATAPETEPPQDHTPEPVDSTQLSPLATPDIGTGPMSLPLLAADQIPTSTPEPPTPTFVPEVVEPLITPTLVELVGEAPTATPTLTQPLPTSTLTPTPVTPLFTVGSLKAFISGLGNPTVYVGPSTVYTPTGTLSAGQEVLLLGRTQTGEWVYMCCQDNEPVWIRQANALPSGNELQSGAPTDSDPNNVRWLNIQPTPTTLRVLWTPPPVAAEDFLLYRYDRANRAQFTHLPNPPATFAAWAGAAQAGQALISPVIVSGQSVIVASADNHLYSFDRSNGSQRWRFDLSQPVRKSPMVHDGIIYIVDDSGQMSALEDRGNEAVRRWIMPLGAPPATSFNAYSDTLLIGTAQDLKVVNRENGTIRRTLNTQGGVPVMPAIGGQLLFVGGTNSLVAYDIYTVISPTLQPLVVWQASGILNPTAPPVYSWPGVQAVAELYTIDGVNRIRSLDANTGREVWNRENGEVGTGLAVNDATLFISGNGYVKALSRRNGDQLWRTDVGGNVLGGPYADNTKVIIYLENGTVQFLDATTGAVTSIATLPSAATDTAAAAISGQLLFAPGADGRLQALSGLP